MILAVLIKLSGKGPVIYTQQRAGRLGVPFTIYKFRSMYFGTGEGIPLLSGKNDKRITLIGRFMRKHKLDEIPNFINVLKGEMSLVGPRPEQQYFIDQIIVNEPKYSLLQNLKPGITSWGQVKYGYASNVDQMIERLNYDLYYLENRSLWFDLKIIFYTIGRIFKGEGV
jgi:lipopolysaccharide/colanic/teichoic acid biosynthesis glycosyltransferase